MTFLLLAIELKCYWFYFVIVFTSGTFAVKVVNGQSFSNVFVFWAGIVSVSLPCCVTLIHRIRDL